MDLRTYLATKERGAAARLAESLGVSLSFLCQMSSGASAISPARCVELEQKTNGEITRKALRPDDWNLIWPELEEKTPS